MNQLKNELEYEEGDKKDVTSNCEDVFMTEAPTLANGNETKRTLSNSQSN